ncbi:hypothetical protein BKA70DRAFT_175659 [Coprinopsis sp. MPI-PUGE-AT-0042]|nr:hypothetical protein BKA70DRAFT_175659 [Coprinopsis sp. MPI-PUGE-AT-0042]
MEEHSTVVRNSGSRGNVTVPGAAGTHSDVHNHVHHHYAINGDPPRLPPGWDHIENHRRIQIATLGRSTRGTCLWIRQMENWCIWLDPEGYLKIMWGYGMPGAGKTVLASIVIDILEAHARASALPICVNYIYFRYSDHTKATVRGFLETLVKQTVERHPHCLPMFDEVYAGHIREKTQPSEEELLSLYQRLSGTMSVTFCILDALDEAPPEIQLEILEKLSSVNVKLFITSRPLTAVESQFPQAQRFRIIAQDDDIELHFTKEISRSADLRQILQDGGPSLRSEMATSIIEKCGGMFLHASLQLEALRECTSIHEVKTTLATFSTEIEDLYLETWKRIASQTEAKVLLAKKVLLWVINATRSLTVDELRHALATCPNTHRFDSSRLVQEGILLGLCRGLVGVEEETRLVRLVHYTAKNTLERLILETFPEPHAHLTAVCLARLAESGFQRKIVTYPWEFQQALEADPLLGYAYHSWSTHTQKSLTSPLTAGRLTDFVANCHSFPFRHNCLDERDMIFDVLGPLHLVSFFDLPIAFAGSDNLRNLNQGTTKQGETALHLACMQGNSNAVEELLQLDDILVNALDIAGTAALMLAAGLGHEEATRVLLARPDIRVNAADEHGRTALIWAARNGHKGTLSLLISHPDIDVNQADDSSYTPLIKASETGNGGINTLLLSHPDVDVNAADWLERTALIIAAGNGHEGTVKLLLSHPNLRDVNARDTFGQTALFHALSYGLRYAGTAKLLLSHPQVDVNVEDMDGRTALNRAAKDRKEDVVGLLLTHPSIRVGTKELEAARAGGHDGIVCLLEEFLLHRP